MTNKNGRFGIHGGQYIPETLMNAVIELEEAYNYYKNDPESKAIKFQNLDDPAAVNLINSKFFAHNPLDLGKL